MPELRLSDAERDSGIVLIKSDCYPRPDGSGFIWIARHPSSGWVATGEGRDHQDCTSQVNAMLTEIMAAQGVEVDPATNETVHRRQDHYDTPQDAPCSQCGKPSNHIITLGERKTAFCCACYVASGSDPAISHPGCLAAAKQLA